MEVYLKKWIDIIEGMNNDNTYKLAWGRSIIEAVLMNQYQQSGDKITIDYKDLAKNVLKYYWNQIFFFQLKQGPNDEKPPIIYQITNDVIEYYIDKTGNNFPVWFDRATEVLENDPIHYIKIIKKLVRALKTDVSWRFPYVYGQTLDIYILDRKNGVVHIDINHINILKEYGILLIQLLNYKWAQLLEKFNRSPKIVSKVKGSQENQIRRSKLYKYKEVLLQQFKGRDIIDFYTGDALDENDISIDHVIPWSFLYSDDIWNLVITSKLYNSRKSNQIPTRDQIEKLKERNTILLNVTNNNKMKKDLIWSIMNNIIDKTFIEIKG